MSLSGDTSTTGAGGDSSQPLQLSDSGETFVQSVGSNIGEGAASAVADNATTIGANLVQGALSQLTDTLGPYAPYIAIGGGVLLLLFIGRR